MMLLKSIKRLSPILFLCLALPVFLLITNPEKLPLPLLMVPIVLVFIIFYTLALGALRVFRSSMAIKKRRVVAGVASALPTLLFIFQSIQQLSAKDVLIVLGLWLICVWYLQRVDFI